MTAIMGRTLRDLLQSERLTDHRQVGVAPNHALRVTQDELKVVTTQDREEQFLVFFLSAFVEDVLYNLTGDFPYGESWGETAYQIREEAFTLIVEELVGMGRALQNGDSTERYKICQELIATYSRVIGQLRELTERQR